MGWVRKFSRPDQAALASTLAVDPDWMREYPAMHDYLTVSRDEEGRSRRTSTITVFAESGGFKVFLNERDLNASLCSTGETVAAALGALEVMLESDSPPWRWNETRPAPGGKKGRHGT
jgi:hypothetical protein